MADPWALTARAAARAAGRATADILRYRRVLADLADIEARYGGPTLGGDRTRLALQVARLRRDLWRDLARKPAQVLLPPVAWALTMEVIRRG